MTLIDTHAHLYYDSMYNRLDDVLDDAQKNEVNKIICIGTDVSTSKKSVDIANKYDSVYAAVGVHPHDSKSVEENYLKSLEELALSSKKVVAIGEIGIDHYRNLSPSDVQKRIMIEQMELAESLSMTIIFHNRDADKDIIDTLSCYPNVIGVSHCFSSTLSTAKKLLDMGYYISFSGNLTFKNSTLPSVAKYLPLNRLLVETDSPYLSPEPFRGKSNEPGRTRYVAEKLAEIHNISFESIANQTTKNINKLFSI